MSLQLRDNLHWCDCDGRAVFLDTLADVYFCLSQAANDAFLRAAAHATRPGDTERLHVLVARGMLIEAGEAAVIQPPPLIDAPTHDLLEGSVARASLLHLFRALASELRAAWMLRTRPFHAVIEGARHRRPGKESSELNPARPVQEIAAAAATIAFMTRSHDRCLVRALAVHSICRKSGFRAKLVFGVIAHPFTAHCWVQLGSRVLVGGYEQARLYTPILVLE